MASREGERERERKKSRIVSSSRVDRRGVCVCVSGGHCAGRVLAEISFLANASAVV